MSGSADSALPSFQREVARLEDRAGPDHRGPGHRQRVIRCRVRRVQRTRMNREWRPARRGLDRQQRNNDDEPENFQARYPAAKSVVRFPAIVCEKRYNHRYTGLPLPAGSGKAETAA